MVVVVCAADLDVVVAVVLGRDQVEPSDRAQDVALRDAEGVVELGDAGGLEPGVALVHPGRVGQLVRVDEITERSAPSGTLVLTGIPLGSWTPRRGEIRAPCADEGDCLRQRPTSSVNVPVSDCCNGEPVKQAYCQ